MPKAKLRDVTLTYEVHGDPQDPPLLLVMGFGGQLIQWPEDFIERLVEARFFVVTFDNRDAGQTYFNAPMQRLNIRKAVRALQQGEPLTPPYQLEDMARDVVELMDHLTLPKAHVVGSSLGGMLAQLIALHTPERLLSLVCIGSSSGDPSLPPADPQVWGEIVKFLGVAKRTYFLHIQQRVRMFELYNPGFDRTDKAQVKSIRALAKKEIQRRRSDNSLIRQIAAVGTAQPRGKVLRQLALPTLILQGELDPVFSVEHGENLHQLIPGSRLTVIEGMGHGVTQMSAAVVADEIIQFIK